MNKFKTLIYFSLFLAFCLSACNKDDFEDKDKDKEEEEEITPATAQNILVNNWINDIMPVYYLWESTLPRPLIEQRGDPEEYFYDILHVNDKWSFITDDFEEYFSGFQGSPTSMGYSPAFYLYNDSENLMIVVKYVYANSPAKNAGLKRGDIILKINDNWLTPENYYNLYSLQSYTTELATLEGSTLNLTGETIQLTAQIIETNPVLYHNTYNYNGKEIGYLVYSSFLAGKNDFLLDKLDEVFSDFMSKGITELVVDLRYNNGGDMRAATHLASALVPKSTAQPDDIFLKKVHNQILTNYFIQTQGPESAELFVKFKESNTNLNLNEIYFMTTSGTASASEAVIAGLMPYINTTLIGTNTNGKYTGMYVIDDTENPARHNYGIMPVTFKYQNTDGYSDFDNGIPVDYEIIDDLFNALPFGDPADPMLAKAIELITGEVVIAAKSQAIRPNIIPIQPQKFDIMNNLWEIKKSELIPSLINHNSIQ